MRSCCKYNIENVNNYFLIKTEMCYWEDKKSLKVKLIKHKTYETAFEWKGKYK